MAVGNESIDIPTIDFAAYLARITGSKLTGLIADDPGEADETDMVTNLVDVGYHRLAKHFEHACERRDVTGLAERIGFPSVNAILKESRYADLLVVDQGYSESEAPLTALPTHEVKRLLHESECPVVISPASFSEITEIVMAYDGGKSSVYAIKQFVYLFPEFRKMKLTILKIDNDHQDFSIEKHRLTEWLQVNFDNIEIVSLEGEADDRLLEYLLERRSSFLVIGGYGRNRMSRLVHPSSAAPLVRMLSGPIFITHP